jgi:transposase
MTSDVSDEEWEVVAPYLSLLPQTAAQRRHEVREVFNAVRSIVRTGAPWRWLPTHFPPWEAVYQQTRRWIAAGCFEAIVQDLRLLVRAASGRRPQPSVGIVDSRTLRSTVESGARAGVDGNKRVRGSKVHAVVDTLGTLLAVAVTPANEAERRQLGALAQRVQEVTGESVELLLRRCRLHRRGDGSGGAGAGHAVGRRATPRGQPGLCPPAQKMGGGAQFRLGQSLPPLGARLRAPSRHLGWAALRRLHLSLTPQTAQVDW